MSDRGPQPEDGNRNGDNALLLGVFVVLVAAGVWLVTTMAEVRKVQDCAAQGRRNCEAIVLPEHSR